MAALARIAFATSILAMLTLLTEHAPTGQHGNDGMVVEDIVQILRDDGIYASCPPGNLLIGSRCKQMLSMDELKKVNMFEDYTHCVQKNVEYNEDSKGEGESRHLAPNLTEISTYCMRMCMLRAEGL